MDGVFGNAKFIKANELTREFSLFDPLPLFRREIEIDCEIENARIFVISPSFACFYINGKRITNDLFITPVSNYEKLLWYNSYEVTNFLKKGKNAVCAIAGNGFFNEPFLTPWEYQNSSWRDAPQILLSLWVNGELVLVTDEKWRASRENSPVIYSHLRSGEYFDARKKDDAWLTSGYDDEKWTSVICKELPSSIKTLPVCCPPVRECETLTPVSIEKSKGGYLVDFGKNISGYAEITLKEKRGSEISLRYCEEVDEKLTPKYAYLFYHDGCEDALTGYDNMTKSRFYPCSPFQLDKIIASGEEDKVKPNFTYHGFRFVEIIGLSKKPSKEQIKAHFVHQAVQKKADFYSGNEVLNFIYDAGIRSTWSNMFWSLTDCPTREKLGWTNDASASCEQILINFSAKSLFEKWFTDLKTDMRSNGSLPGIIPSNGWGDEWGVVCDNLLFELPYRTYLYTDDAKILTDAIPYFEKYIDYLHEKVERNHQFILGDWTGCGNSPLTPKEFVRDFFFINALKITLFAHSLNKTKNEKLRKIYLQKRREFADEYITEKGESKIQSQTAIAMLICSNLSINDENLKNQLVERVRQDEFKLTAGMVGVQYLYDALTKCGRSDYALKLIAESEPGYATWYKLGATSLWERWDGLESGSHNHHMFSNVIAWFFKSLLGVNVTKPAYKEIQLQPCFIKELGFVQGFIDTPYGKLSVKWRYENGSFIYTVVVPNGVTAIMNGEKLKTGENEIKITN